MAAERHKIVMFNPKATGELVYDGPPLAVLVSVALLDPDRYDVKIVDWHDGDYEERLRAECADATVFGVTSMTGCQIGNMLKALELVKSVNPDIKTVAGGWHPTLMPQQTIRHRLIDYIVLGQGPFIVRDLVNCICGDGDPSDIKGVGYKEDGQCFVNERPPLVDVSDMPQPPYHLLDDYEEYLVQTVYADRVAYVLTSQGCPSNCYFCSEAAFHYRRWTGRTVDEIIEFIKDLKDRYNIDGVAVSDSNFFVDEKRVAEFCRRLIPLGLKWGGTSSRSDQLARYSDETWQLMADSGLYDIFLGVESADNETLKVMNKGNTIEDTLAALPKAKEYGIRIQCAFVIGSPGVDIEKDFKTDMAFINRIRKTGQVAQFHMFTFAPFPGAPFMDECIERGYKLPEELEDWGDHNLHMSVCPWIPPKYPKITDQLSVYFMFLCGNARSIVASSAPKWLKGPALLVESLVRNMADFRVEHSFFRFPLEYKLAKFVVGNRNVFFKDKKLLF